VPEPRFLSSLEDEFHLISSPVVRLSATTGYSLASLPDKSQELIQAQSDQFRPAPLDVSRNDSGGLRTSGELSATRKPT
jgi:hypothetical protein